MHRAASIAALVVAGCASVSDQSENQARVPDSIDGFNAADANCHAQGKFAELRNVDLTTRTILVDCVSR